MILSMTGFGRGTAVRNGREIGGAAQREFPLL